MHESIKEKFTKENKKKSNTHQRDKSKINGDKQFN